MSDEFDSDEDKNITPHTAEYAATYYAANAGRHKASAASWEQLGQIAAIETNREHIRLEQGINSVLENMSISIEKFADKIKEEPQKAVSDLLSVQPPNFYELDAIRNGTAHRFIAWGVELIQAVNSEGKEQIKWPGVKEGVLRAIKYGYLLAEANKHADHMHAAKSPEQYGGVSLLAMIEAENSGDRLMQQVGLLGSENLPIPSFKIMQEALSRYFGSKSNESLESLRTLFPGDGNTGNELIKAISTARRPPISPQKPPDGSDDPK